MLTFSLKKVLESQNFRRQTHSEQTQHASAKSLPASKITGVDQTDLRTRRVHSERPQEKGNQKDQTQRQKDRHFTQK